jgi:RES domain-containing protein
VILWRYSQHESLDGRGGLFASARWHTRGREVLYCAPNPATALLEVLVHAGVRDPAVFGQFRFLKISAPDHLPRERAEEGLLPANWPARLDVSRAWGDRWLRESRTPLLAVRCVLLPETDHVLVNPRHPAAAELRLLGAFPYPLDPRIFARGPPLE